MNRFKTLLLREWMQHRTGWALLAAVPMVLLALAAAFGMVEFDEPHAALGPATVALVAALLTIAATALLLQGLAWAASVIQSPGLARRDRQDRSAEYWLSLPVPHAQSVAATLTMHLIVVPMLALGVGLLGGAVLSAVVVTRVAGFGEWLALPWAQILGLALVGALRVGVGLVLATLWLSPLILGTMAASAWLKRWGVPAVALVLGVGGLLLESLYGITWVLDPLRVLARQAAQAFLAAEHNDSVRFVFDTPADIMAVLADLPRLLLGDLVDALGQLVSPVFVAAMAASAAAFALLWWRGVRA